MTADGGGKMADNKAHTEDNIKVRDTSLPTPHTNAYTTEYQLNKLVELPGEFTNIKWTIKVHITAATQNLSQNWLMSVELV